MQEQTKMDTMQFSLDGNLSARLTDWEKEPTLQDMKQDLESAKSSHDAQMLKIREWSDHLLVKNKAKPAVRKDRSSVQPKLIRRQAEWRYSALTEPFLSSSKLFQITPVTFEDEDAAKQNELLLNWQFRTKMNKVKFIDDYVRAIVDEGTGIVQVGWQRSTTMIKELVPIWEHYAVETQEQVDRLQQAIELKMSNPRGYEETTPADLKACVDFWEENGSPTYAQQVGEQEVEVEKVIENRPTVKVHNPQNVVIDPTCEGDLDKALFVAVSFETHKAELLKTPDRYKNLDKVNWESASPINEPDHETESPNTFQYRDVLRKKVVAYEYWGYFDVNNTGELVSFVATWIGDTLIRMELNPFPDGKLPFVLVPYLPIKRELYGETDAELLIDNQKILGAVTRGMIDLLGRSANGQQGFAKGMLDPLNRRKFDAGQDYEFNPNVSPTGGIIDHKYPEIPQSALTMLTLQNQEAEALTGVKSFGGGISGESYGNVATGIRGALDAASKREMAILRRLAKGMSEIGQKFISMNTEFLSEKEVIRVTNKEFVTVYREDLVGNFDLEVDISTAEVDNAKSQDLGFMLQTIGPNLDQKISLTLLSEIALLKRMPALAEKLKTWEPTPDPLAQKKAELEIAKLEAELAEIQSRAELNAAKAEEARSSKDLKDLNFVEQETGTKHARDIDRQTAQAEGNQNLQITKALLAPVKQGETKPNVEAAVGFNQLSDSLNISGQAPQLASNL